tara:strand:+ start:167 stop:448 length:282 start_codon:yes stop_codon:yes gene_type:complete
MAKSKHHRHKRRKGLQPKLTKPNSVWRTSSNNRKSVNKVEIAKQAKKAVEAVTDPYGTNVQYTNMDTGTVGSAMDIMKELEEREPKLESKDEK